MMWLIILAPLLFVNRYISYGSWETGAEVLPPERYILYGSSYEIICKLSTNVSDNCLDGGKLELELNEKKLMAFNTSKLTGERQINYHINKVDKSYQGTYACFFTSKVCGETLQGYKLKEVGKIPEGPQDFNCTIEDFQFGRCCMPEGITFKKIFTNTWIRDNSSKLYFEMREGNTVRTYPINIAKEDDNCFSLSPFYHHIIDHDLVVYIELANPLGSYKFNKSFNYQSINRPSPPNVSLKLLNESDFKLILEQKSLCCRDTEFEFIIECWSSFPRYIKRAPYILKNDREFTSSGWPPFSKGKCSVRSRFVKYSTLYSEPTSIEFTTSQTVPSKNPATGPGLFKRNNEESFKFYFEPVAESELNSPFRNYQKKCPNDASWVNFTGNNFDCLIGKSTSKPIASLRVCTEYACKRDNISQIELPDPDTTFIGTPDLYIEMSRLVTNVSYTFYWIFADKAPCKIEQIYLIQEKQPNMLSMKTIAPNETSVTLRIEHIKDYQFSLVASCSDKTKTSLIKWKKYQRIISDFNPKKFIKSQPEIYCEQRFFNRSYCDLNLAIRRDPNLPIKSLVVKFPGNYSEIYVMKANEEKFNVKTTHLIKSSQIKVFAQYELLNGTFTPEVKIGAFSVKCNWCIEIGVVISVVVLVIVFTFLCIFCKSLRHLMKNIFCNFFTCFQSKKNKQCVIKTFIDDTDKPLSMKPQPDGQPYGNNMDHTTWESRPLKATDSYANMPNNTESKIAEFGRYDRFREEKV